MSPETIGVIGLCILLICIFFRMNIGLAMASIGFFGFAYISGMKSALGMLGSNPYNTIAYYPIAVVPLFVFMGAIISNSGMGTNLFNSGYKLFGQMRGGLCVATVAACALFAAMCGSSMAETLTIGKIALPEMKKYKYDDSLSSGCVACAGSLAILIPPSMGFVLYGILTEQSVGVLFMAGVLPGILLSAMFFLIIMVVTLRNPKLAPPGPRIPLKEKILSLKITWVVVALFLLVLGGIYMGVFTPTEAGAIGAFGAIVITFISRQLNFKTLLASIAEAGVTTAMIMILIVGAFIFMKFMAISKLPFILAGTISGLGLSPYVILAFIVIIYIILGMLLEINSAMVLTIPLIYPVITALGFDPIWFGVIVVILMEMGLATPPVGMNVFILASVTDTPMGTIFKGVWPFVAAMLFCIIILTIWPKIVLFLPSTM
jgi:C4-dicarboxylate transporter DctM subunit